MLANDFHHRNQCPISAGSRNVVLAFIHLVAIIAMTEAWNTASTRSDCKALIERISNGRYGCDGKEWNSLEHQSRRGILRKGIATIVAGTASSFPVVTNPPRALAAAAEKPEGKEGLMTASTVADLIRPIPTFTIVDKNGIPFTVVGEDAKVTGYFFTTYGEAARILELAKKSADKAIANAKVDKEEDVGANPWKNARVSTVPLDYAVTVVSKSMRMTGGGVYFKVAPAEDDIDDALAVTGDKDLSEGKVPLFYYEDFTIDDGGKQKTPLYFRKEELQKQWRRSNPKEEFPKTAVTELFSLLTELVRPGGTNIELRNVVFVSPKESESKRRDCLKKGGNEPSFVVGKRIIVL
jgi:hypothetical protein